MDLIDQAQLVESWHRDAAIAAHHCHRKAADESAMHCVDPACGSRIPEGRRRAIPGVQYCIECQTSRERQQRKDR